MEYNQVILPLVGVVTLIVWGISYWKIGKKAQIHIPDSLRTGKNITLRLLLFIVGISGLGLISYSMSEPRIPKGFSNTNIEVNDIYFVVDVSRSMLANDFYPNRLEAAKKKIDGFVGLRPKDRIGIIMFAEKVFTLLPLTTDLEVIKQIISEIKIGFLGSGTNIGDALGLAVGRLVQSPTKNKVIILLTDGVSNVGTMTPIQAAEESKKHNIKVYTIGIGGSKNAKIPLGSYGYQNIPGGSIDLKTLNKISTITGGKSYIAQSEKALQDVLAEIESLERTEIKASGQIIYDEKYYQYLLLGVVMFVLAEISRRYIVRELA